MLFVSSSGVACITCVFYVMRLSVFFFICGVVRLGSADFLAKVLEICIFVRNIYILTIYFYNDIFITVLDVKIYVIGGKICTSQKRERL